MSLELAGSKRSLLEKGISWSYAKEDQECHETLSTASQEVRDLEKQFRLLNLKVFICKLVRSENIAVGRVKLASL